MVYLRCPGRSGLETAMHPEILLDAASYLSFQQRVQPFRVGQVVINGKRIEGRFKHYVPSRIVRVRIPVKPLTCWSEATRGFDYAAQ